MNHAFSFWPGRMHRTVNGEAGRVDGPARAVNHLAAQVDLDQTGGGDLVKTQSEFVDQVNARLTRHSGREVGIDGIVPTRQRGQPVGSRQVSAHLPLSAWSTV